ncbi:La ribonucleoprotein domain member 4B [Perkinsus chesapeaki]|uniref:La ribonucleoprotein domain member 4B n=1 Tax=Perkinsus chesapeaki TaxID=330153 RepID=A0A7J6MWV0_PERCH|nr:La ribonucleoprotein domain member 4B [Perkinsus chesapeaki]
MNKNEENEKVKPTEEVGKDKLEAVKTAVEGVLSKEYLKSNQTFAARMNAQMYMSLDSLFNSKVIEDLNTTAEEIANAITTLGSSKVALDSTKTQIKPIIPDLQLRTTVIVRDVDSKSLTVDDFKNCVLKDAPCDMDKDIVDIRPDVNDHWYVRFTTEDKCENVALWLRNQKYNGNPIHTAVKAEHFMLTLFPDLDKNSEAYPSPALNYGSPAFTPSSPATTPYQGYSSYNPYAGVDQYGYYHPSATKGKGKGKGKGGRGRRRMSSSGAPHEPVEQIIDPSEFAGDETKYKYDYRKYTKEEIESICESMPAEAVYKPEGMVKAEKQVGEGLIRDKPNREWIVEGSPVATGGGGGRKASSSAAATASPAVKPEAPKVSAAS